MNQFDVLETKRDEHLCTDVSLIAMPGNTPFWIESSALDALKLAPESVAFISSREATGDDPDDDCDTILLTLKLGDRAVVVAGFRLPLLVALLEAGVPHECITRRSLKTLGSLVINPGFHLRATECLSTRALCDFIGIGQSKLSGGEMLLHSEAFGQGPSQLCYSTDVDVTHIMLLTVAASYWDRMPERLKLADFVRNTLPRFVGAETVPGISQATVRWSAQKALQAAVAHAV